MSRTRIVKGKITEVVEKDYNIFSESNIIYNAAEMVTEKGETKGVSYGISAVMTSDETVLLIENNINVYELNLKDGKKTLLKNLAVPQNMELAYIRKDEKNSKLIAYYFGSEQNSTKSGICYLDKGQYISLPDGYYINTYDDFFYTLIDDKPYSSYAWSDDRGKTWKTKKIEEFFIVPTPTGYADKGYVYKLAALFKGSQEEKGARLVIGHPVIK